MCNTFFKKAGAGLLGAPLAVIGGGLTVAGFGAGVVCSSCDYWCFD